MSFAGTMEAARAERDNYRYQEQVAKDNADSIQQQGDAAVESQQRKFQQVFGSMTAAYGGTGVDTTMGSPLNVLTDAIKQGTLDKLSTQYNFTVAKQQQLEQARLYRIGAKNAINAGWFNAQANAVSGMGGQMNTGGYGQKTAPYAFGGNSLTPGSEYTGTGSLSTHWGGDGSAATGSFNGLDGSGTYTGYGSTSTSWGGFGAGWG
ncbi:hypothetical protein EZM97_07530 [Dyella soli]|uniref:Uncharacterized protein n=2 Tax=Dyella TaxID=231454 RepID=A0A4R0Z437_9GAMM|nr:hypothetical protein [Dyella soli]TCI13140.1 hypothetical protein EZM97_07530 [Dyella soli]